MDQVVGLFAIGNRESGCDTEGGARLDELSRYYGGNQRNDAETCVGAEYGIGYVVS